MYEYHEKGLKIPFNWVLWLIRKLAELNKSGKLKYPICEIYAADNFSLVGSGRAGNTLTERKLPLKVYVEEAHRYGLKFEYLWNAISMGGNEWENQDKLHEEAEMLREAEVDSVTVTLPILSLWLKKWFPDIRQTCSVNNHADSIERVRQLTEYMSYDRIMLDHRISRRFKLIQEIRDEFPEKPLIVLVNESCLPDCVLQHFHQDHLASCSRLDSLARPDICQSLCSGLKLKDPLYTLRAPWVRPEDIHHLFDVGVDLIKLAGRTKDSAWILELARAYAYGEFEGDIWPLIEKSGLTSPEWQTALGQKLEPCRYGVENGQLNGFISPFVKGTVPCAGSGYGCGSCRWCHQWMSAVTCPSNRDERLRDIEEVEEIVTGTQGAVAFQAA